MTLVDLWAAALALALLLYVLLDGFDLGVGLLFPLAPGEPARRRMLAAISPVWDGNETWLVVAGATLFGAFPLVYATLLSAFYLPVIAMLAGLILRGVAFEFRYKTVRFRPLWDAGFVAGSVVATLVQGTMVGALVQGLPIVDGRYVGGPLGWLSPFALLCGIGLCLGYALIGACWLIGKSEGEVRDFAYRVLPWLLAGLLAFLAAAFVYAVLIDLPVMRRWFERPYLVALPVLGVGALAGLVRGIAVRNDRLPFPMAAVVFLAAFGTLAASFLPYMVPFSITIAEAAAPESSLRFLFWGAGLFVFPLTLAYTAAVYFIFRGKVAGEAEYE
ncbi:cytochrome d ubiquinol oxidase subunit II [Methylobacterium frigidaeris]|uniref:Cytochrome bd-I ubiquinol oxidase subunit 2 n=1 Tax=Methylobacterium frigidaeris TaxID=2038277 RepID=A0AA37H8G3_9HYPH|nr:cytochrome d ubiquinol oxidase subunit II [Methylobacterium frigidaeris]GJD60874.1 Cytochrome bd-I ubiquinol oxidase subunit 2 [Methylobacterium frigidaeris]